MTYPAGTRSVAATAATTLAAQAARASSGIALAASLKIGGLAAGAALAGPLAGRPVTACLLIAAGLELCAAAAYVLTGSRSTGPAAGATARSEEILLC